MKLKDITPSDLICSICGNVSSIYLKKDQYRKRFYKQLLYCYICQKKTIHIEIRQKDIIEKELEYKERMTKQEKQVYQLIKRSNGFRGK